MDSTTALPLHRVAALAFAGVLSAHANALDAGCVKAISAANLRMIDAPAFHSIKQFGGTRLELIKAEGRLFSRMGPEPWGPAPMKLQELKDAVRQAESLILSCERGGRETVNGMAAEVYRFTAKDPTGGAVRAQVWIGLQDGLPYKEESGAVRATTAYANVKAPR